MTVKAKGLDHVAIAVKDLEKAIAFYQEAFGLELAEVEEVKDQKVRTAIFGHGLGRIELICPTHKSRDQAGCDRQDGQSAKPDASHLISLRLLKATRGESTA